MSGEEEVKVENVENAENVSENVAENASEDVNGGNSAIENKDVDDIDESKLFVGGLSWQIEPEDLREYFSKFGEVARVSVKTDPNTGNSRGFGFVIFKDDTPLNLVFQTKEHKIKGKAVDPKRARARPKPKKVFIGGLDPSVTEEEVRQHMEQFGEVEDGEFPYDKAKNQRRAFCFITFTSHESAQKCCAQAKQKIGPRDCDVKMATVPKEQGGGFGGGRGGGFGGRGGWGGGRGGRGRGGGYGGGYGGSGWGGGYGRGGGGYGDQSGYDYSGYGSGYDYSGYYGTAGYGQGYDYSGYYGASGYGADAAATSGAATAKKPGSYHPYQR